MRYKHDWLMKILGVCLGLCTALAHADPSTWLLVESDNRTLTVLKGKTIVDKFHYVALGRGGTTNKRERGDDSTPLGEFHIAWINRKSPFHLFFGLDFPTMELADEAYRDNRIDRNTYYSILDALRDRRLPPQNTPLGGRIGIHGLGNGDPQIHHEFNWTKGCVALTNPQIDRLAHWVQIGTRVVIR
jgi:murein L,D-transpeptidase YafK